MFSTVGTRYEHSKEYFITCSHCRETGRQCHQLNKKEYNEANRLYREANKENISKYRKDNKEKISLRGKQYREANKEKIILKRKKHRENNRCMCSCGIQIYNIPSSVKRHETTNLHNDRLTHKQKMVSVLIMIG